MKELEIDRENQLTVERFLHVKHYVLILDKTRCVGCDICRTVCPREAVTIKKQPIEPGRKAQHPLLDINAQKCSYCGICVSICPFHALCVKINGENLIPAVDKDAFPQLLHEIDVDESKCSINCVECEKACPLNLIKVVLLTSDDKEISHKEAKSYQKKNDLKVQVDIQKNLCPCCRICETKCPTSAIHVRKIFHGTLDIDFKKCPPDCRYCLDVCPIPGALYFGEDGKIYPNEKFCVFCGVCKSVCPIEGAITMERCSVHHTPIKSGAWNKAIEKLTSIKEYSKESQTKRGLKVQKLMKKRVDLKGVEIV